MNDEKIRKFQKFLKHCVTNNITKFTGSSGRFMLKKYFNVGEDTAGKYLKEMSEHQYIMYDGQYFNIIYCKKEGK